MVLKMDLEIKFPCGYLASYISDDLWIGLFYSYPLYYFFHMFNLLEWQRV